MLLFLIVGLAVPGEPASALVFYVGVFPCLLARLSLHAGAGWRMLGAMVRQDRALALAAALIVWSGLTLLWGIDDKHRTLRFAVDTACTLGFLAALAVTLRDAASRLAVARTLVVAGTANAAFSIARAFVLSPVDPRLHGWGMTIHPILGALVMAVAYLTAFSWFLTGRGPRWISLPAALVMGCFILMTESRGPLIAMGTATLFLCAAGPWRVWTLAALALLAGGWYALPGGIAQHGAQVIVRRGTSYRLEIFHTALDAIGDRPLLGHGLAANMRMPTLPGYTGGEITFPHDLYLSLLFYSGVPGLLLFIALGVMLLARLCRGWEPREAPWLLALLISVALGGLTDLGQVTKGPGVMWVILWLPVGLVLGWWQDTDRRQAAKAN